MHRRRFLQQTTAAFGAGLVTGSGALTSSYIPGMSSIIPVSIDPKIKKRLVIMFSPNGMVRDGFWPKTQGPEFEMDRVLKPLEPFREQTLVVHGICNKIRGDGDGHMRGMSALLTANELFPGNIQGGGGSPAGWAKGISIDQEIKNFLQSKPETKTRFGSLEFGVRVPNEANPWTRMVYAGSNQPIAPINDPYAMSSKLYGKLEDQENLMKVLELVQKDMGNTRKLSDRRDKALLKRHASNVKKMRAELSGAGDIVLNTPPLKLSPNVADEDKNMPELAKMQMDLMVNSFVNDFNRVATLQYSKSVGQSKMRWLNVNEGHHGLSHKPDEDKDAQEKLTRINTWYCEQLAYLCKLLKETKEPGTDQSMLDNTLVLWTNELGHGNSHTLNNLPMVMVGGGFGFEMGRFTKVKSVSTDRLWLSIAHAMGHKIKSFGLPSLPQDGPLEL